MGYQIIATKEGSFERRIHLAEDEKGEKILLEELEMIASWKELNLVQELRQIISQLKKEENSESILTYQGVTRIKEGFYLILPYHQGIWEEWTLRKEETITLEEMAQGARAMVDALKSISSQEEMAQGFFFTDLVWGGAGEWRVLDPRIRWILSPYRSSEELRKYFIPPEKIKGAKWTVSGNLYTIGMSVYYLVTRKFPFPLERKGETMTAIIKEEPVDPRCYRPDLGAEPAMLLRGLLQKNPDLRPGVEKSQSLLEKIIKEGTARALPADEEEYRRIGEETLRRREKERKVIRWGQRLKWPVVILVVLVALVLLAGRNGYEEVITENTPPDMVVSYFYQALAELDLMRLEETLAKGVGSEYRTLVTNLYVTSKMREVYEGIGAPFVVVQDLVIREREETDRDQPFFIGEYTLKLMVDEEYRWQKRREHLILGRENKKWKIISIDTNVLAEGTEPLPVTVQKERPLLFDSNHQATDSGQS